MVPKPCKVRFLQLSKNCSKALIEYDQLSLIYISVKEFGENFVKISNNSSPLLPCSSAEKLELPKPIHFNCLQFNNNGFTCLKYLGSISIDNVLIFGQLLVITLINIPTSPAFLL